MSIRWQYVVTLKLLEYTVVGPMSNGGKSDQMIHMQLAMSLASAALRQMVVSADKREHQLLALL
jgi:hypothetical protein